MACLLAPGYWLWFPLKSAFRASFSLDGDSWPYGFIMAKRSGHQGGQGRALWCSLNCFWAQLCRWAPDDVLEKRPPVAAGARHPCLSVWSLDLLSLPAQLPPASSCALLLESGGFGSFWEESRVEVSLFFHLETTLSFVSILIILSWCVSLEFVEGFWHFKHSGRKGIKSCFKRRMRCCQLFVILTRSNLQITKIYFF